MKLIENLHLLYKNDNRSRNIRQVFENKPLSTDGIEMKSLSIEIEKEYSLPDNKLIFNIW